MKLILVRHGETLENRENICQGQTQGTLSEKGRFQAQSVAMALAGTTIDFCYTSDLRRAAETCQCIVLKHPGLRVTEDVRLRERYFGPSQGKSMPQGWDGLSAFEGAEPLDAMYQRVSAFMDDITATCLGNTVLVVSHGITLKLLVAVCLGHDVAHAATLELVDNCSISILETGKAPQFIITEYNTVSHLESQR